MRKTEIPYQIHLDRITRDAWTLAARHDGRTLAGWIRHNLNKIVEHQLEFRDGQIFGVEPEGGAGK